MNAVTMRVEAENVIHTHTHTHLPSFLQIWRELGEVLALSKS